MSDRELLPVLCAFCISSAVNEVFPMWARFCYMGGGIFLLIYIKFSKQILVLK